MYEDDKIKYEEEEEYDEVGDIPIGGEQRK